MDKSLSSIVRVLGQIDDQEAAFLGTGIAVTSNHVLTCKHVVMERDPEGNSIDVVRQNLVVQNGFSTTFARVTKVVLHPELI